MQVLKLLIENRHREYEIAINTNYGGFALTKEMCEELNLDYKNPEHLYMFNNDRANLILIDLIKKHKPKDLEIVKIELEDIPKAYLQNHDGMESIVYSCNDFGRPLLDYLGKRG